MPSYTVKDTGFADSLAYNFHRKLARKSNGDLWVAYFRSDGTTFQIYVSYSTNEGVDWTEEQITNQSGSDHQAYPSLAVDSNDDLHLIWYGTGWGSNSGYDNLQYRKRTSEGWQDQEAITDKNAPQADAAIAVDSNNHVHVIWYGGGWGSYPSKPQIQYRKRTDSWQTQEAVTNVNYSQYDVTLAIDSNNHVHVIWHGYGWGLNTLKENIQYRKRTTSWQTQETITDKSDHQGLFSIAIDSSDVVHVVWHGTGWGSYPAERNIQYRKRTTSWQAQEAITNINDDQYDPTISLDANDDVHVVWFGFGYSPNAAYYNLQYRKRTTSWQTRVPLTAIDEDQTWCNLIWALRPGDPKTNRPRTGYTFVWMADDVLKYHASADLTWHIIEPLTGTVAAESSISGSLKVKREFTTTVAAASTVSGSLNVIREIVGITIAGDSNVTGSIGISKKLTGTVTASSTTSGQIKRFRSLSRTTICRSTVSGTLSVWVISGTVTAQSGISGTIKVSRKLTGTVAAQSSISGELKFAAELKGVITLQSAVSGLLRVTRGVTTTVATSSTITGTLKVTRELVSVTIAAQSSLSGTAKVTKGFTTTVTATSGITGLLIKTALEILSGAISADSAISGRLKVTRELVGVTSVAQSTVSGTLRVTRKLVSVVIAGQSVVSGNVILEIWLTGAVTTQSVVSGALSVSWKLTGLVITQSVVSGPLKASKKLQGTIASQSTVSGLMPLLVIPRFAIIRTISILPAFAHVTYINEERKSDITVYNR